MAKRPGGSRLHDGLYGMACGGRRYEDRQRLQQLAGTGMGEENDVVQIGEGFGRGARIGFKLANCSALGILRSKQID
jgi:hypothetical protein